MNLFNRTTTIPAAPVADNAVDYIPNGHPQCETCGKYLTPEHTPRAVDIGGSFGTVKHSYCDEGCVPPALRWHIQQKKSEHDARETVRIREVQEQAKQNRIAALRNRIEYLTSNRAVIAAGGFDVDEAITETQVSLDKLLDPGPADANWVVPPQETALQRRKALLKDNSVDRGAQRFKTY